MKKQSFILTTPVMILMLAFVACETRVSSVTLNKSSLTLDVNSSEQLFATVYPEEAINKKILWESSDRNVVTVTADGIVTAQNAGIANITVTSKDRGKIATCKVNVHLTPDMEYEQAKNLLFEGENVPSNYPYGQDRQNSKCRSAVHTFRRLAENGYAPARYALGYCYSYGWGVSSDIHESVKQLRLSAEQDYAPAQFVLGNLLYNGYGRGYVEVRDASEGEMWLRKAAAQGVSKAVAPWRFVYENHPPL